jgi:hypothetical protein
MALGDPELEPRISGAICLGTPFLHFGRRGLQVSYRDLAAIFGVGLVIPLMIFAHSLHITGPAMMLMAAFTLPVGYFANNIMRRLRTQTEAKLAELPLQCKASEKFLLIRAPGDEASSLLSGIHLLNWIPLRIAEQFANRMTATMGEPKRLTWVQVMAKPARMIYRIVVTMVALYMFAHLHLGLSEKAVTALGPLVIVAAFAWEGKRDIWSAILGTFTGVLIAFTFLIRSFLLGTFFGPDLAKHSLFLEITAEPSPPGVWKFVQLDALEINNPSTANPRPLAHCVYEHPSVPRIIAEWIRKKSVSTTGPFA